MVGAKPAPTDIAAAPDSLADRRPVTVMFIDLSGYTAMSTNLDPEDTHRLLKRFFEVVDGVVVDFGGTIDKHIGDNVMALFGAPLAHGKDAERAIRAALAVHAAMPGLSTEFGRSLSVHIGMALGEVVASGLGSASHTAYTVTGDAANLAARLMDLAATNETLVSDAVRQATETVAAFEPRGQLAVKGLAQPQAAFCLVGLVSDQAEESELVGRTSELSQLLSLIDACRETGRGAAAAIRGDPGIGKSRLLREVLHQAEDRGFQCVRGSVLDFGARVGEDAVAAITANLLGASVEQPAEAKRTAVVAACQSGKLAQEESAFAYDLLGLPQPAEAQAIYAAMDTKARRRGKAAVLARLATAASSVQPLLIAVEDLHWATEEIQYLLARLAAVTAQHPATMVMTTRFDNDPFDANWRADSSGALVATIDLRPLRAEDATRMASWLKTEVDDFSRQCVARAEGNPLFLEQLLRSRVSDSGGPLPHTVQGVVLARLDGLPETDRRALQAASVLGQRFAPDAARRLLGDDSYDYDGMIRRHLLKPEGDMYLFAHALIRDGVYASITRERRRALHLAAAGFYAGQSPALWAEHLDRAEDLSAPQAYLAAAEAEAASYRIEQAIVMAQRGMAIATRPEDTVKLALAVGQFNLAAGQAGPARTAFEAASQAAQEDVERCRALVGQASANRMLTNIDEAFVNLDMAETLASSSEMPRLLSEIHYIRGNLHFARGERSKCLDQHRHALAAAERAGEAEWQARAYSGLGDAAYQHCRMRSAAGYFRRCIDIAKGHGLLRIIPANQCMVGDSLVYELEIAEALSEIMQAYHAARQIGDRFSEMFALQSESYVLWAIGRIPEAEAPTQASLEQARKLGARRFEAFLLCMLSDIRFTQHRVPDAKAMLDDAMAISQETGFGFCGPIICSGFAQLHGLGAEGRAWIDRGLDMLVNARLAHNDIFFRKAAIDWAIGAGDWALVDQLIHELLDLTEAEPLPYVDFFVARAKALAALHHNREDVQATETLARLSAHAQAIDLRPLH